MYLYLVYYINIITNIAGKSSDKNSTLKVKHKLR